MQSFMANYADLWLEGYRKHGREWWVKKKQSEIEARGQGFVEIIIKIMNEKRGNVK